MTVTQGLLVRLQSTGHVTNWPQAAEMGCHARPDRFRRRFPYHAKRVIWRNPRRRLTVQPVPASANGWLAVNLDYDEQYELFQSKALVDGMLDRLRHHCTTIRTEGRSLRTSDSRSRSKNKPKKPTPPKS